VDAKRGFEASAEVNVLKDVEGRRKHLAGGEISLRRILIVAIARHPKFLLGEYSHLNV